ncbi:MAG: hypothetical protein WC846_03245 [Candidatus Gracilibacteria bacterium]|jgi:hypothetical protein
MKKLYAFFLSTLLLSACGAAPAPITPVETPTTPVEMPAAETTFQPSGIIDFLDTPVELSYEDLMLTPHKDEFIKSMPDDFETADAYLSYTKDLVSLWKTGTIKEGSYSGQALVLARLSCDGPCPATYARYALDEATNKWTMLVPYTEEPEAMGPMLMYANTEKNISIPDLEVPEELKIFPNTKVERTAVTFGWNAFSKFDSENKLKQITSIQDPSFPKYYSYGEDDYSYLLGMSPDGLLNKYMIVPQTFATEVSSGDSGGKETALIKTSGEEVSKTYTMFLNGCGFRTYQVIKPSEEEERGLEKIGSFDGEDAYMLKTMGENPETASDKNLLAGLYAAYNNYLAKIEYLKGSTNESADQMDLESFINQGNAFFLKMDNGAYVLVYNTEYAPMAECGKPVIYLYPEKPTTVNVQVGVDEFTKTEPLYLEGGWTVLANPDGLLKNLADGLPYPYLFWEGKSYKNIMLGTGWTLKKDEVATALPVALTQMGLNAKETADFMDFWSPRLAAVASPYIEFNFVPQRLFDQVAPLTITPAPDSILRIFMYFKGVNQAGAKMPAYTPFVRHGFTVIEWGGTLY